MFMNRLLQKIVEAGNKPVEKFIDDFLAPEAF